MSRSRAALAATLVALLVAACTSASPSQEASQEPSQPPSAAASSAFPFPSLPSSASDLEALIPDEIGGVPMQKASMQGSEFLTSGSADPQTEQFLQDLGVSPDAIAVAFGFGFSTTGETGLGMFVFRAEGAGTDRLVSVFKESTNAERESPLEWETTTIGGKQVETAVDTEQENQAIYLYAVGDVLFLLSASNEGDAAEAIAGLP